MRLIFTTYYLICLVWRDKMNQQRGSNLYGQYPYFTPQSYSTPGQAVPFYGMQPSYPQTVGAPIQSVPMTTGTQQASGKVHGMLPIEESYIENILRLNKGKLVAVHATFENNREWNAKIFNGVIEAAGRDHLILSDPQTGERYLLPMVFVDYVTFQEEIEYEPIFGGVSLTSQPPR